MYVSTYYLEYGRHIGQLRRRRRRAYAATSNTTSHANHEKFNSWVPFSFLYDYEASLGGPSGRRSSGINSLPYHLETDIDDCTSHPCKNNGTCTDRVNGFNCSCAPGFNGTQCEKGNRNSRLSEKSSSCLYSKRRTKDFSFLIAANFSDPTGRCATTNQRSPGYPLVTELSVKLKLRATKRDSWFNSIRSIAKAKKALMSAGHMYFCLRNFGTNVCQK